VNLPADENVLTISDNRAIALLAEASEGGRRGRSKAPAAGPLRDLGKHPKDGEPVHILAGRFGPYVKHGKLNASLPKSRAPEDLSMEEAMALLDKRAAAGGGKAKPAARGRGKAASAKAAPAKRPAAKAKPAPRKRASTSAAE
jgi:DNA topoisomerase I